MTDRKIIAFLSNAAPNSSGFTLAELMIVVGIVGFLAMVAIPKYNRMVAKAHQSEAKIALSGLFTLEQTFMTEYEAYNPYIIDIGYSPEGQSRWYALGSQTSGYTVTITNYTPTDTNLNISPTRNNNPSICNNPTPQLPSTKWLGGAYTTPPCYNFFGPSGTNPQTFGLGAVGGILQGAPYCDYWYIDNAKNLLNVQTGY
jgi:prepilin-type N-terminal cleavage/methylation domain-containing protein